MTADRNAELERGWNLHRDGYRLCDCNTVLQARGWLKAQYADAWIRGNDLYYTHIAGHEDDFAAAVHRGDYKLPTQPNSLSDTEIDLLMDLDWDRYQSEIAAELYDYKFGPNK